MGQSSAKILSEFTDLLNAHGAESPEVRDFRNQHEKGNSQLAALFATVVKVQAKLKAGKLTDSRPSQRVAYAAAPAAGERNR